MGPKWKKHELGQASPMRVRIFKRKLYSVLRAPISNPGHLTNNYNGGWLSSVWKNITKTSKQMARILRTNEKLTTNNWQWNRRKWPKNVADKNNNESPIPQFALYHELRHAALAHLGRAPSTSQKEKVQDRAKSQPAWKLKLHGA